MSTYLVTGSASGIGAATATALRSDGHEVIGVDLAGADIVADLADPTDRRRVVDEAVAHSRGYLAGAVFAAGVGPSVGRERVICEVNVLGVTQVLDGLQPALAAAGNAKVVVIGSNSTTSTPFVPRKAIRLLIDEDVVAATRVIKRRRSLSAPIAYAASKTAVTRWCRTESARPRWAGSGIRLNVIAPGPVNTPMLRSQLDSDTTARVRDFPVPIGHFGDPDQLAAWVVMMLSPSADFMVGTVVTLDGGTEALLRDSSWPDPLPVTRLPRLLAAMKQSRRHNAG